MNKAIKVIRYAGLSLADFRKLSKKDRLFLWVLVLANYSFSQQQ